MAKTNVATTIEIAGNKIEANVKPDAYDLRDLEYRPRLEPLDPVVDARPEGGLFTVLTQKGSSCTGHAIAAVINTVLARQAQRLETPIPDRVSPYMLYRLARRYDEFLGEDDTGSSLRGAFKGWLRHGVALESQWEQLAAAEGVKPVDAMPDLDNPAFIAACRQRPLGAYYRVNAYRLDDMQSAINELHAIAVSAAIHRGWEDPRPITAPNGKTLSVIKRDKQPEPIGGHAFCIVGYNQIGFLVQNSWGEEWGDKGFATLLYDDWLASAYDAWVCRPGVPSTPLAAPSIQSKVTTTGDIVLSGGPNMTLLRQYVVNTGNDGKLSTAGKFTSTPQQLDDMFANMTRKHDAWVGTDTTKSRHVLIYAHGGVIDEFGGLNIAQHQLGWWLKNEVYPINFCWESGALETIGDALADLLHPRLPFGGIRFDFEEHADRLIEFLARKFAGGLWGQMKGNAEGASANGAPPADIRGGTEIARRLKLYMANHPNVKVHLAGHSAGTIVLSALVKRLSTMGIPIESVAFMGGAATNAQVASEVLPAFRAVTGKGHVKRFTTFNLREQAEQDDTCPLGDKAWYHKSLLYLVARGLEPNPDEVTRMVPVVGLELALGAPVTPGKTMAQAIMAGDDACDGRIVIAPTPMNSDLQSDAHGHADFDNDSATMTSILMRMLEVAVAPAGPYRPDVPVPDLPVAARIVAPDGLETHVLGATTIPKVPAGGDGVVIARSTADVFGGAPMGAAGAGEAAAAVSGAAVLAGPEIQIPSEAALSPESQSPAFDMLQAQGYTVDGAPATPATGDGKPSKAAPPARKKAARKTAKKTNRKTRTTEDR
jgi:hypothetical protein